MTTLALVLVVLVALAHVWFFVLESVLWDTPFGRRTLRMTEAQAAATAMLARNQGAYNGLLALGLLWAVTPWCKDPLGVQTFLLLFVAAAGVVGAVTASPKIILLQTAPALAALAAVWASM